MISVLLITILNALTFYFLGRYAGREQEVITKATTLLKKITTQKAPPIITYPTPQELKYRGSEREKIDKQWEENMKKLEMP